MKNSGRGTAAALRALEAGDDAVDVAIARAAYAPGSSILTPDGFAWISFVGKLCDLNERIAPASRAEQRQQRHAARRHADDASP